MKLLYELPEDLKKLLRRTTGEATPIFCIPYDIEDGRSVVGYFLATRTEVFRLCDGKVRLRLPVRELSEFSIEQRVGSCALLAKRAGSDTELCIFTPTVNRPRFALLLEPLAALSAKEEIETPENDEPEQVCPKCGMPYLPYSTSCRFCSRGKGGLTFLVEATRGLRLMLLFPLLVMACSLAIRFIVPAIQKTAINRFIYPAEGVVRGTGDQFFVLVLSLIAFDLVSRLLNIIQTRLSGIAGNRFSIRIRRMMFERVEALSLSQIQRRSIGYLSDRVSADVSVIQRFLIDRMPALLSSLLGLVVGAVLILTLDPTMSLLVVLPIPFALAFAAFTRTLTKRANCRVNYSTQRYSRFNYDIISGARTVKAFGQEDEAVRNHRLLLHTHTETQILTSQLRVLLGLITSLLFECGSYLLLFFGNLWIFEGTVDVGTISQFSAYAAIFCEPLIQFTELPSEFSEFMTTLRQMREILDEKPEIQDSPRAVTPPIFGHIRVENVCFGYNAYEPVLHHVSLEIRPGEMVGIVGHSGCGKTTLVNLIMRLFEVGSGRITLDGTDIRDLPQSYLRGAIGIVPQETQLFDGTVRRNILYSRPDAPDEDVIRAARAANAHDFILSLSEGYNTRVGDRGYSLSGGERQRIAIARALIHNPKILILDEATAALDTETERSIQEAIDHLTVGRTTIAIAHRLSTLRNADRIIVFDHGRIIESGTHHELIEARGKYYSLVTAQAEAALGNDVLLEKAGI